MTFNDSQATKVAGFSLHAFMKYFYLLAVIAAFAACSKNDPFPEADTVFGPKLKSITTYLQAANGSFAPGEMTEYYYTAGKLNLEKQSQYDVMTGTYSLFSVATYFYNKDGFVDKIEKQFAGYPNQTITRYEYTGGKVSRITRDDEVDTDAAIKYHAADTVEVLYTLSNGRFFTYKFKTKDDNIIFERTIDDSNKVTSETTTEFDNFKNPMKLLGYTDLLFGYYSTNNKTKVSAAYFGSFPTSTPVAYEYEYNEAGYPTTQVTTYKSNGGSGTTGKSKIAYEYSGIN